MIFLGGVIIKGAGKNTEKHNISYLFLFDIESSIKPMLDFLELSRYFPEERQTF